MQFPWFWVDLLVDYGKLFNFVVDLVVDLVLLNQVVDYGELWFPVHQLGSNHGPPLSNTDLASCLAFPALNRQAGLAIGDHLVGNLGKQVGHAFLSSQFHSAMGPLVQTS